ncbi:dihydroxyacetone kinase operon transcriptional regulator DhaR [Vibrio sp. SCSIO 43136]|uniref:dihydroxyacetone kinase operon transcriptional regulator DhaR n=1 Tax=Vibrio sp. SCSIO 43136 TaxID=2819101 RepID=UPI0020758D24|nr:dihydroxyacetone kinase operon transcriptional regulator DhaR [Vibrio sp. SCSIO 43136]USD67721.1 PTS-dependent dihydroxyacetone kinase operon transcriptional regulator DhaR [Vibrio sp. SCSIO 43136]
MLDQIEDTKKKWDFFQKHHWVSPDFAHTPVVESWERSSKRCSAYHWSKPHIASGHTLSSLMKRNQRIIGCATTVIEDTYDQFGDKQVMMFVTDDNGCVLHTVGHPKLLEELQQLGIKTGCFIAEGKMGTNATSIALETHQSSEVLAAEHFNRHLHPYVTSAAPIFDTLGRLRGCVTMVRPAEDHCLESTIVVDACAKEVSLQIHIDSEQDNMHRLMCAHQTTLENMDDGLLGWDTDNRITIASHQNQQLLGLNPQKVLDRDVFNIIRFPPNLMVKIQQRERIERLQTTIEVNSAFIEAIVTYTPMADGSSLLFTHPLDKIRKLAQQQVGSSVKHTFESLPARSQKMQRVITMAKRAIKSKSPILLTGEEGVGKSTLAMAIHSESEYRQGPFISLNCRSLNNEQMLRDTLGYDDDNGQPSKFELAHDGTLYLENFEYLSQELQAVLLKYLKTGLISRHNSQRLIPVKFQLVTSTSEDIREYVAQDYFSRQLYYEISSNELEISPLYQRSEDIELIIEQLLSIYQKRHGNKVELGTEAKAALLNYRWQGNNSELKNRMEKILLNRSSNLIQLMDIPSDLLQSDGDANPNEGLSLEEIEKRAIIDAWERYDGKMQVMAKVLQIGRTTLWRKVKKYGLVEG